MFVHSKGSEMFNIGLKRGLTAHFSQTDADGDGKFTKDELIKLQEHMFQARPVAEEFSRMDTDKSGDVTFEEFKNMVLTDAKGGKGPPVNMTEFGKGGRYEEFFHGVDHDMDGKVSVREFKLGGKPPGDEHTNEYHNKSDTNQDGKISEEEYLNFRHMGQEASEINPVVKRGEEKLFKLYDANKDGFLDLTEWRRTMAPTHEQQQEETAIHLLNEFGHDFAGQKPYISVADIMAQLGQTKENHLYHVELPSELIHYLESPLFFTEEDRGEVEDHGEEDEDHEQLPELMKDQPAIPESEQ
jgi:Ca2+-binding EF-hand superfamily protein